MNTKSGTLQFILTVSLLCIIQWSVYAQKAPVKFGKVVKADLEMKVYPADTSADAAILCDYGYFDSVQLQFVRTLRIKIFKKEGTSWGNQVFPVNSQAIIHGITYNLEKGEIVESKLKSESIFNERVTADYFRTRVAMPNVKEGSIIDLEFSYHGLPNEWRFQQEIPVRWSELIIEPTPNFTFRKNFYGFERLSENTNIRSVAKEMPAFKKEPYMNAWTNYITRFEIEYLRIGFTELSTTWDAVTARLQESKGFGLAMQNYPFLNTIARDIEKSTADPFERLKAAHEAIKKAVKWNESASVYASSDNLGIAFNKKIGNSADINLLLIQLLKKLNFEVYPVVLSTRNNGFLSPVSPSLSKLNYVVAYVVLGDQKYFLDATEEHLPVGMLPERCINLQGRRLINDNKSDWVSLMPDHMERKAIQFDMNLDANYVLSGVISKTNYDYAALNFRKKYEKFNSKEEYLKDFESRNKGLSVINCTITKLDSIYLPVEESYDVKIKNCITSVGNMLYINPLLFEQMTSNPFKTEDRKYPVDFVYPSELTYVFKLTLPESAEVTELPKPISLKLKGGSASIYYQIASINNIVQLSYKFVINKAIYSEVEYGDLRALFSELVKKHAEQIVVKMN